MEDTLAIVFAIMLSAIIMFLFPMMDAWDLQDNLSYTTTYATVVDFVDTVRNVGKITPEAYYDFETKLSMTGNIYNITMEHRKFIEDVGAYQNAYTNEIMESINNNTDYKMDKYDYFYVTVKNTNFTQASNIKQFLMGKQEPFKIGAAYGGIVWSVPVN